MLNLKLPKEGNVLLHSCCAPCSSAVVECMLMNGIRPTLLYYNPNIFPEKEYEIRKNENKRYAKTLGLDFIDADYDHDAWIEQIKGLENEPERGKRCVKCFAIRMLFTAQYASKNGFPLFTTTLPSSRWKNADDIFAAGKYAETQYPDVVYWEQH